MFHEILFTRCDSSETPSQSGFWGGSTSGAKYYFLNWLSFTISSLTLCRMSPPIFVSDHLKANQRVHVTAVKRGRIPFVGTGFIVRGPDQIGVYTVRIPGHPRHHYVFVYRDEMEEA